MHYDNTKFINIKWIEIFMQIDDENGNPIFEPMGKFLLEIFDGEYNNNFFRGSDNFMK